MRRERSRDCSLYPIVLVDDEPQLLNDVQLFLEAAGHSVSAAASFRDAISVVEGMFAAAPVPVAQGDVDDRTWFIAVVGHSFPVEHPPVTYADPRDGRPHHVQCGLDLVRWMRVHHVLGRMLPVICFSGRESADVSHAIQNAGLESCPDVFVTKSEMALDPEKLLDRVGSLEARPALLHELTGTSGSEGARICLGDFEW